MEERESPLSEDDLYEARGDVPLARPIMQGDVFRDVIVPGFDEQPPAVMVTQHPCSMRNGAALRQRLTVACIRQVPTISQSQWQGFGYAMLLPNMRGDKTDYLADFRDVASVESAALARDQRIAALTNYGIHILHQRDIFYQTRLTVDLATLATTFDPIATELELQYEWVEAALQANYSMPAPADVLSVVASAEKEFADYLDENDRARRTGLQNVPTRADIRRQVRREIMKRYEGDSAQS